MATKPSYTADSDRRAGLPSPRLRAIRYLELRSHDCARSHLVERPPLRRLEKTRRGLTSLVDAFGDPQPQPSVKAAPRFLGILARTTQSRPSTRRFFAAGSHVARAGVSRSEHSTEPSTGLWPTNGAEAGTGPV